MKTEAKLRIYSALSLLFSGVALSVVGFIVPPVGEISDSVLWFFAQTLIYAGSVFGVSLFIQNKFDELRSSINDKNLTK